MSPAPRWTSSASDREEDVTRSASTSLRPDSTLDRTTPTDWRLGRRPLGVAHTGYQEEQDEADGADHARADEDGARAERLRERPRERERQRDQADRDHHVHACHAAEEPTRNERLHQ